MIDANRSAGFKDGVHGILTAENAAGRFFLGDMRSTHRHEIQHAIYDLMKLEIRDVGDLSLFKDQIKNFWTKKDEERRGPMEDVLQNKKEACEILEDFYNKRLSWVLERGKDEIMAFMRDRDYTADGIYYVLTQPDGSYNYFKEQKKWLTGIEYMDKYDLDIASVEQVGAVAKESWDDRYEIDETEDVARAQELEKMKNYFGPLVDEIGNKVFIEKYHKILKEGLIAFESLKKSGVLRDVIVRILTHEPLDKWPKVAKRIIEQRK